MPKRLKQNEPMPMDFWNYHINPILGYKYDPLERNKKKEYLKYGLNINQVR